ncbi:hypothetical protein [Pantoea septica]|uniref:hypothetical protein n=1 Tax=Pantoea septica TaxID=472695 RepID=UPI003CFF5F1F
MLLKDNKIFPFGARIFFIQVQSLIEKQLLLSFFYAFSGSPGANSINATSKKRLACGAFSIKLVDRFLTGYKLGLRTTLFATHLPSGICDNSHPVRI